MKIISNEQVADMLQAAEESPRKRSHIIVHESHDEPVQRIFIGLKRGTYVRPHRHPHIGEFGVVVSGHCSLLLFDDAGKLTERHEMGPQHDAVAFDLKPNEWHAFVSMSDEAVFVEAKQGPFDPDTISEYANWAPPEGDAKVANYLAWMESIQLT